MTYLLRKAALFATILLLLSLCPAVWAGNIDPGDTGCQFAWAENVGWINLKPSLGTGVSVSDTALTGYAWGENIGWIKLNPAFGGVLNNGTGTLSGYAWAENVGWIKFNPTGGGVYIDACGDFNGRAWGENIGWISFRSDGANPFRVRTSWVSPLDTTPPVTTSSLAVQPWYQTDTSFSLSATDCGTGVKELHYSINGNETISSGVTATVTVTNEGCNNVSYYAIDKASPANVEAAHQLNVCIDKTPPLITLTAPADNGTYFINTPATPLYTVTDSVSGVSATGTAGVFSTSQTGSRSYTVSATDKAGNVASVTHTYTVTFPGNVDPGDTGCQYAWAENVGWINFKPSWGPGVTVTDTAVTGRVWGENVGWINLSPATGGIVNNTSGNLSGYAWGENVGWINFRPTGGGVTIGADGKFSGYAWGENIGWINFSAANTCVKTAWVPSPTYSVTYNGNTNTGGSVPVDGNAYAAGATVTVLGNSGSLVKTGYTFAGWNTAANGSGASYAGGATFAMGSANVTLFAQWTLIQYPLKFVAGNYGVILGTKTQTVSYGNSSSQVKAVPLPGFHLLNWTGTNGFVTTSANPLIVSNVTASQTITANFAPDHLLVAFITDGHGSISGTAIQLVDYGGSTRPVTAKPATGYHFVNWTGTNNFSSTEPTLALTNVTTSHLIKANFAPNQYILNFTAGANGSITGTHSQTVNYGGSATAVKAIPATGYHFINWTGDNGFSTTTANPLTVKNIKASQNITANFAINRYTITFVAGTGGSISGDKSQTVDYGGSTSQVTAVPAKDYHFVKWTGTNGFVSTTANPLKLDNVKADQKITATFAK